MPQIGSGTVFHNATPASKGGSGKYVDLDKEFYRLKEDSDQATPIVCEDQKEVNRIMIHVRKLNKGQEIKVRCKKDATNPLQLWLGVKI